MLTLAAGCSASRPLSASVIPTEENVDSKPGIGRQRLSAPAPELWRRRGGRRRPRSRRKAGEPSTVTACQRRAAVARGCPTSVEGHHATCHFPRQQQPKAVIDL